jgi:hypothetical protein
MELKNTTLPSSESFYGASHLAESAVNIRQEFWLDPDQGLLFEVPIWWDWRDNDPRKTGAGYQPRQESEGNRA